jgi:hypothetical protein
MGRAVLPPDRSRWSRAQLRLAAVAAARFFADIVGLPFDARSGHFAPVRVNDSLTFLFDDDASFDSYHYAFQISDTEFDSIFERIKQAGLRPLEP